MGLLERGFKAWAEQVALSLRREMGLHPHAPLPPKALATQLDIDIWTPQDVPGLPQPVIDQLLHHDPDGWSAVSCTVNGKSLIIHNPRHSMGRQNSDLAHELAHIILEHAPSKMVLSHDGAMVMRSFDEKQEEEANWLGWALLLPRAALTHATRLRLTKTALAAHYGVSEQLLEYRTRMTGLNRKPGRQGAHRSSEK